MLAEQQIQHLHEMWLQMTHGFTVYQVYFSVTLCLYNPRKTDLECTQKSCCQIKQGICVYLHTDELQYFSYVLFLKSSTHFKVQNYRNISPVLHKFSHFLNNNSHNNHLNPDHRKKEKTRGGKNRYLTKSNILAFG